MAVPRKPASRADLASRLRAGPCRLLAISPFEEDHHFLARILPRESDYFRAASSLGDAVVAMRAEPPLVVLTERDLPDGGWRDVLLALLDLPRRPELIVASVFADDGLWVEVLEEGGYDVLPKPFEEREVARVVNLALSQRGQLLRGAG